MHLYQHTQSAQRSGLWCVKFQGFWECTCHVVQQSLGVHHISFPVVSTQQEYLDNVTALEAVQSIRLWQWFDTCFIDKWLGHQ